ncbi:MULTISPECIES: quinoprotein dehydrogenase-associated SoxYZ-like carrier [unclassified Pseudomonas]|uniref:quinoprotein dehydrogenase-associated SoxYZ-like carrier n=1 Tax=unclassified Pseudomonas TaxID=196821 RepID=UPI0024486987|nr:MULTISPECIES: quinoprotein dehydrogenase-associated SoxYZ-like carrier [unclassified Pseudomonas]MDG9930626.1 quinoprotein dehydrogenase-associated SoxYZ-like carrier [Pseudomonas sp. GD04042]MDH0481716.1 quinoprotein dehydrogenase-associated SoxYZ-like carrier [Pseudomonas sp. GD04015]MDH0603088.1 quinoprotein dehydrogenase-associated SoxYZ-like carrier [Pseudomonas sp. GD03869]
MSRVLCLLSLLLVGLPALALDEVDPLHSPMWEFHRQRLLGAAPVRFDERVRVQAPPFAEDSRQVPIEIDARALERPVQRMLAWAELNPIPHIFTLHAESERLLPFLAVRIRIEQATLIRAAVQTEDGVWHVGSTHVEAAGGGCTAPSVVRAQPGWEQRLGQVLGGRYPQGDFDRLRLSVSHPMDNGLVGGIPEFYLESAELRDPEGHRLALLELFPAVSENPTLGFELRGGGKAELLLRDNNGNEFEAEL